MCERSIIKLKTNAKNVYRIDQPQKCKNNTLVLNVSFMHISICYMLLCTLHTILLRFVYIFISWCVSLVYFWMFEPIFQAHDCFRRWFLFLIFGCWPFFLIDFCCCLFCCVCVCVVFLVNLHRNGPLNEEHFCCFQRYVVHF